MFGHRIAILRDCRASATSRSPLVSLPPAINPQSSQLSTWFPEPQHAPAAYASVPAAFVRDLAVHHHEGDACRFLLRVFVGGEVLNRLRIEQHEVGPIA